VKTGRWEAVAVIGWIANGHWWLGIFPALFLPNSNRMFTRHAGCCSGGRARKSDVGRCFSSVMGVNTLFDGSTRARSTISPVSRFALHGTVVLIHPRKYCAPFALNSCKRRRRRHAARFDICAMTNLFPAPASFLGRGIPSESPRPRPVEICGAPYSPCLETIIGPLLLLYRLDSANRRRGNGRGRVPPSLADDPNRLLRSPFLCDR